MSALEEFKAAAPTRRSFALMFSSAIAQSGAAARLVAQQAGAAAVPPHLNSSEARGKLPPTLSPTSFQDAQVVRAYRIAKAMPTVIAQQPCYCWCNRMGPRSLLSCYMDEHASFCDTCMKEAFLADRLTHEGKSPAEIRTAIVRGEWKTAA